MEIVHRAARLELDFHLVGHRRPRADVHLDGIQRELGCRSAVLLHGAQVSVLAEGKELDEGLFSAQAHDNLARRTLRPFGWRRVRRDFAFMLFALMHRAGGFAQFLDGHQPAAVLFTFTQPARVTAPQDVTIRRVEVVVDHVPRAGGAERVPVQLPELE